MVDPTSLVCLINMTRFHRDLVIRKIISNFQMMPCSFFFRWLGRLIVIVALINIPMGLIIFDAPFKFSLAYYVYIALLVVIFLVFTIRSSVSANKSGKVTYVQAEADEVLFTETKEDIIFEREELDVRVMKK